MLADITRGRRMLLTVALCAALGTAVSARAQTARVPGPLPAHDPAAAVAAMLRSDDPREQAWGAHYAGRDHLRQLAPELHQLIASRLGDPSQSGNAALSIALDALVQLSMPDLALLPRIYDERPVEALILASLVNDSKTDAFLLDAIQSAENELWFAAANLLLRNRSRALAAALLDGLRLSVRLHLVTEGAVAGGGGAGGGVGCGASGLAPGLPPWPAYDLSTIADSGRTVVATGPVAVYYRRIVAPAGQTPAFCDGFTSGPMADHRVRYLVELAALPPQDVPVRGYENHSVVMRQGTSLEAEIARIETDVSQRFARLLRAVVSAGMLESSIADAYQPVIDFRVDDWRTRR